MGEGGPEPSTQTYQERALNYVLFCNRYNNDIKKVIA